MRARWTTPAREQLISAYNYSAEENRSAAAEIMGQIEDTARILGAHPEAGRLGRVAGTRELVISGTPFVFGYKIEKKGVWILAVMHGARKWPEDL